LQGVLVAPIPRWTMVLGKVLGGTAIAMLQGIVFLLLGWIAGKLGWFEVISPTPVGFFAALVLMFVVSIALTGLGFLIAWRMDSTQGFHAIMSVFLMPMWLLSGAFFPPPPLTPDMSWISWGLALVMQLNPLTYGVAALRRLLYLNVADAQLPADTPQLATCWIVTFVFAAVMFALACKMAGQRTTGDML